MLFSIYKIGISLKITFVPQPNREYLCTLDTLLALYNTRDYHLGLRPLTQQLIECVRSGEMTTIVQPLSQAALQVKPFTTLGIGLSVILILLLIVLILEKEGIRIVAKASLRPKIGVFDGFIVPLVVAFGAIVAVRIMG